jgi:predicted nucleic acid-binding protein
VNVLVDTSVWSLALRSAFLQGESLPVVEELRELIVEGRAELMGPVRQELLSGLSDNAQFLRLRERLRAFPDHIMLMEDYELAAEWYNACRKKGVQGAQVDFLICAVAANHDLSIFTTDKDFMRYQAICPIRLHPVRPELSGPPPK